MIIPLCPPPPPSGITLLSIQAQSNAPYGLYIALGIGIAAIFFMLWIGASRENRKH